MDEKTSVLLVTANVGSIFEDPDVMLKIWIQEFSQTVSRLEAKFIALHCQEVGGKNYETRMQHVENFVQMLLSCNELQQFDKAEIFLDEDFSCAENFTALGNFYFVHESVTDVLIWNFEDLKFQNLTGRNVHSGNIEEVPIKEKSKFPQNFFPECKWSRKGYLRTRWQLNGTTFDLVNIHLFHDASNFVAMQAFPSVYTITRQKALQYTLDRFYDYAEGSAPFFLFGDFNFRTDTRGVIKKLTTGLSECKDSENVDDEKLEYKDDASEVIITIGKKEFSHLDHQNIFISDAGDWLKEFDREMEAFKEQLFEYPIEFLPSYPYEENSTRAQSYMKTRCPAWCDRVLLSITAKQLINEIENSKNVEYGVIGKDSCMGDHKPVFLFFDMVNGAGIISTKLPIKRVFSACRPNHTCGSVLYDALNDTSPVAAATLASKSHPSFSAQRNESSPPVSLTPCSNNKKHHRNVSRCCDASISVMSVVTEISDRASDQDQDATDSDASYHLANSAAPILSNSKSIDHANFNEYKKRCAQHGTELENGSFSEQSRPPFGEDNVSLHRFRDLKCNPKDFVSRSFDESVAVRSNSACTVIESTWRSKTCTCLQEGAWRMRSISTSSRTSSWTSDGRVRLKSDPNLKTSLLRLQSHHSSSDEEWFEEVDEPDSRKSKDTLPNATEDIQEYIEFDALRSDAEVDRSASESLTPRVEGKKEKSRKARYFLFCIPRRGKNDEAEEAGLSDCKVKNGRYFKFLSSKNRKSSRWCCAL